MTIMARFSVALILAAFASRSPLISHSAVVAPLASGKFFGGAGANSHWVQVRADGRIIRKDNRCAKIPQRGVPERGEPFLLGLALIGVRIFSQRSPQ
jgi:hypothetical protein